MDVLAADARPVMAAARDKVAANCPAARVHEDRLRAGRELAATATAGRNRCTERYGATGRTRLPVSFAFLRLAPGRRCTRDFQSACVGPGAAAGTTLPQSSFRFVFCRYYTIIKIPFEVYICP